MTYAEAQTEFQIRLYRWAKIAQEEEMRDSFPSFKFCKEWPDRTCQFLRSLDPHSQRLLGEGMLQAAHRDAATALGEGVSAEAERLMQREESYRISRSGESLEGTFAARNNEDKPKAVTNRQLKKAIRKSFLLAFGDQCVPVDTADGTGLLFSMQCRGWTIKTGFDFGRWDPGVSHSHNVWTGKWITKEEPAVFFANCIGFGLSYGNVIGIGSGWENIAIENIEPVCAEVIWHCRRMFNAFPDLLQGLELESLTA